MGSSRSTSGGGGRSRSTTSGYQGTISPKKTILSKRTTPYKEPGMGPMESLARSGTTGLATATPREAETIRAATGKSFNAISKNIGEVGSKYRRPADVEKYAKELKTIEEGKAKGAKTFVGPDGVERVNFIGTGMKDEEGRTILSKSTPILTAKAPTLKELGGDIVRGLVGYKTLEYTDESNIPTMVEKKGLIDSTPTLNLLKTGIGFFKNAGSDDSKDTTTTTVPETTQEFAESEAERKARLAKVQGAAMSAASRNLFAASKKTIKGQM